MVSGLEIRMNRIMNQGRMLCIPMDHGISNGPIPGLEDPHKAIAKCANHGLTSVIINKGILKSMPKPTRIGILVHFSSSTSLSSQPNRKVLTGTVEEAVRLGADGVSLHINIGGSDDAEMLSHLGEISDECHMWNMPLLAMMYPRGENVKNPHDPQTVAHVARIGAECGADIVKTVYTGDVESFSKIVKSTPVPIVVAGGPKTKTDEDLLKMTYDVMQAGAKGVTYGRNIFAHKNPGAIPVLLVIPALYLIYNQMIKKRRKAAIKFSNLMFVKSAISNKKKSKRDMWIFMISLVIIALMIIGFADPHIPLEQSKEGVNVVFVIDNSGSMLATDYTPNRLEAAKSSAAILLDSLNEKDHAGIVIFENGATTAAYLSPFKGKST